MSAGMDRKRTHQDVLTTAVYELARDSGDAVSAVRFATQGRNELLVTAWDGRAGLSVAEAGGASAEIAQYTLPAALLDGAFDGSGTYVLVGGLDRRVYRIDKATAETSLMGTHDAAVKCLCWDSTTNLLISGSWDKSVRAFDVRQAQPVGRVDQPQKVFSMDCIGSTLVVAMANRLVHIFDTRKLSEPMQQRESSLKYMTRCVRCMPNGEGYASSSIEGRVAVEFFDSSAEYQSRRYAFKCHRVSNAETGIDTVYPVNTLAFHPVYGTFSSGGGDGVVALWDGTAKKRLRQYPAFKSGVSSLCFSADGKFLAIGVSDDFEQSDKTSPDANKVWIRELAEGEGRPKSMA